MASISSKPLGDETLSMLSKQFNAKSNMGKKSKIGDDTLS
jgi:hypothetical protein